MIRTTAGWPVYLIEHAPALILVASVVALATALAAQYLGGLPPCSLCHYQRWPYIATICLAAAALSFDPGAVRRALVAFCGIAFVAGAGVASYHVGVEQGWLTGPAACSGANIGATTIEELRRQLLATPVVRCDEVAWSMFGISFAGYNLIASLGLAAASLFGATKGTDLHDR